MKISEMSTEQATDTLVRLTKPIGNICDDEDLVKILQNYHELNGKVANIRAAGKLLPEMLAFALKSHKRDVYEIVGCLIGKTCDEVAAMLFTDLLKEVRNSYDEVFRDFFISSVKQGVDTAG